LNELCVFAICFIGLVGVRMAVAEAADRFALRTCRESLVKAGFDEGHIITTLEMRMKCGVGKCGRCNIGGHFICLDGPIFTLEEIGKMHSDV
jgi:hypothetical protein